MFPRRGDDQGPLIVGEIGVNHDGLADRALGLARLAIEAGADAVKFQFFEAERLVGTGSDLAGYQARRGETDARAMLARLELSVDELRPAVDYVREQGRVAIATVFSRELVEGVEGLGFDAYKAASPDVINRPLLERLIETGKPLLVSTGAADEHEVERAIGWIEDPARTDEIALLQCVSSYPTSDEHAALGGILALRRLYDGPVGYSDHTITVDTGALAIAAGAVVLEKHFTDDRRRPGPDHGSSLEPEAFAEYAALARRAWSMVGVEAKLIQACERDVRRVARQSIVAARDLPIGHVIAGPDLTTARPTGGIEPWRLDDLIGQTLMRAVRAGDPLLDAHFSDEPTVERRTA